MVQNGIDSRASELQFVEAQQEQVSDMLALYNYYITNSTATFDLEAISADAFLQRIRLHHPDYKTYIIRLDGSMVGFCFFVPYRQNPAYRMTVEIGLYFKPACTGKRYGEAAVHHLEQVIREHGYRTIIASISSDNTPSIRLFERLGYRQCADYREIAYKHGHYVGIVDFQKVL